jgi:hypothetical protein
MKQDQQVHVTKRPSNGGETDEAMEFQDLSGQVPQVDDLLSEIDQLLQDTKPQDRCRC